MLRNYLEKLISFKSVSLDHKENERALDWLKKEINHLSVFIEEFKSKNFLSLVITTQKTKKPKIWLQAHIDVVPGPEEVFFPIVDGSRLYGRGAYDMKFAIAAYLKLLNELGGEINNYDFGIMITSDEELGGANGVKYLLDKGFSSDICFLPDGGDNWNFQKESKGVYQILVKSNGKSAHSSRPWEGDNAINHLLDFLSGLSNKFAVDESKYENHFHDTLTISKIGGGDANNNVPYSAFAIVDIRFTGEKSKEDMKKIISKEKEKYPQIGVKNITLEEGCKISSTNDYLKEFSLIAFERFNIKMGFGIAHGSSDARFFGEKGVPVILTRPKGGGAHSTEEWIDLSDLERFYEVLKDFVKKIAVTGD